MTAANTQLNPMEVFDTPTSAVEKPAPPANPPGLLMKYFVLKPKGKDPYAKAARDAMRAYANSIESVNPVLAEELHEWAKREMVASCTGAEKY